MGHDFESATGLRVGLLFNFNASTLVVKRIVSGCDRIDHETTKVRKHENDDDRVTLPIVAGFLSSSVETARPAAR